MFKPYFVMIVHISHSLAHNWRDGTLPFPTLHSPPPHYTPPCSKHKEEQILHVVEGLICFPFSWSPYVVRFVHSLFRAPRAISRHQNSFRAQPPSQVIGQWGTANENRKEQQCGSENQQRLKKQEMTEIRTENSLVTTYFAVCSSFALVIISRTTNHEAIVLTRN